MWRNREVRDFVDWLHRYNAQRDDRAVTPLETAELKGALETYPFGA